MEITEKELKRYDSVGSVERKVRPSNDFTSEVFDFFFNEEQLQGVKVHSASLMTSSDCAGKN